MKKCIYCGNENRDDARFCTACGKPFVQEEQTADLYALAYAYTANRKAAKQIAQTSSGPAEVRIACLTWIRSKNTGLFQDAPVFDKDIPVLNEDSDISGMDYEERIVSLLHNREHMSSDETAAFLGIPVSSVTAYLQSAYLKVHPEERKQEEETIREKVQEEAEEKGPVSSSGSSGNQMIQKHWRLLAGITAAAVLGTFLAVHIYAKKAYEKGMELLTEGNYEEAVEVLQEAKRFHGSKDAAARLAEAYLAEGNYASAVEEYEVLCQKYSDNQAYQSALVSAYQAYADTFVKDENYTDALVYLQKAYALEEDEYTRIRIRAAENNGSYTDEDTGTLYDAYGRAKKLYCRTASSELLYSVEVTYNEDGSYDMIKATDRDGLRSVNITKFPDDAQSLVSFIPEENQNISYHMIQNVYDGNEISSQTVSYNTAKTEYTYQYTYNEDGTVSGYTVTDGEEEAQRTLSYDENQNLIQMISTESSGTYTYTYTYTDNRLSRTVIRNENNQTVGNITYTYDDEGRLTEQKEYHRTLSLTDTELDMENRTVIYRYSNSGIPYGLSVMDSQGEVTANGIYIHDNGWIILYNEEIFN